MGTNLKPAHVRVYWRSGGVDLALRNRLETDVRKGRGSASAICRRALAEHYGLSSRSGGEPPVALTDTLAALQAQVAQLTSAVLQLTAAHSEIQRLSAAVTELQRQNESLRLSLVASAYGDRTERAAAAKTAAAVLANGSNGHD